MKTCCRLFNNEALKPRGACLLVALALCLSISPSRAQPKSGVRETLPLDRAKAEEKGRALVTELLQQKPEEKSVTVGAFEIRGADRKTRRVPIRFEITPTPTNTVSSYEASAASGAVSLVVLSTGTGPNEYLLRDSASSNAAPRKLGGEQTMIPFANSDFWVADLGLEFLHWPKQAVLRNEMSRGQSCEVLESTNPQPVPGAYSRVVSWIAAERPGVVIVFAEAYDSNGKLLKQFEPKKLEKIRGQWQLQQMEIRNIQANSRTRVIFDLEASK